VTESLNGILMRKIRFSETSLIVTWFSDRSGKIKTIAKGALRPKAAFTGKLDLFFQCDLLVSISARSEIHTLREVAVRSSFDGIRKNYLKTSVAAYFIELVERVTELDHPVPEIYDLLIRAFGYLDQTMPDARTIPFFESELCKSIGLQSDQIHSAAERLKDAFGTLPRARADLVNQCTALL
jgi:DNA repair protein RecO (recombination protein O)